MNVDGRSHCKLKKAESQILSSFRVMGVAEYGK